MKLVQLQPAKSNNENVVKTLQDALDMAKAGKIKSVSITAICTNTDIYTAYDTNGNAVELLGGLQILQKRLLNLFEIPENIGG